ncbi:MAG: hypothetical protein ABIR33_16520 [Pyrinomonadaceae bacterium]
MTNPQYYKSAIDATGCISNAWNLIKPNYWLFFGVSFVAALIIGAISYIPFIGAVIAALLSPLVMAGVYYIALRAMRGEAVDFGMMFKGFEKAGPLLVIGAISSAPTIIFTIVNVFLQTGQVLLEAIMKNRGRNQFQGAPEIAAAGGVIVLVFAVLGIFLIVGLIWGITFAFAVPIAIDQDVDALTAIKLSARSSWANFGGVFVLMILGFLIMLGGFIACCFGMFFVLPIVNVAWAFAYRQVFPDLGPNANIRYEPPSPDVYQGSFGQGL